MTLDVSKEATFLTFAVLYFCAIMHYIFYENMDVPAVLLCMTASYFALRIFILSTKSCLKCIEASLEARFEEAPSEQCACSIKDEPMATPICKPKSRFDLENELAMEQRAVLNELSRPYGFGFVLPNPISRSDNSINNEKRSSFCKSQLEIV